MQKSGRDESPPLPRRYVMVALHTFECHAKRWVVRMAAQRRGLEMSGEERTVEGCRGRREFRRGEGSIAAACA